MTYNEWRDELKSNLLCVSEAERRRVLDYYAEAYADRRDAGFSEREIIADFGAPYDAAQKILYENTEDVRRDNSFGFSEPDCNNGERKKFSQNQQQNDDPFSNNFGNEYNRTANTGKGTQYAPPPPQPTRHGSNYTWVFVLLCVIFCVPIFGFLMGLFGITIGLITAPFGLLIGGIITIGAGIGTMFADFAAGFIILGMGLILFGVSLVLIPLCAKLVKLMWTAFKSLFSFIKGLFDGRRQTI